MNRRYSWERLVAALPTTLAVMLPGASSKEAWEREYASGRWDSLRSADEANRYALILGHLVRRGGRPSLLDVGCGAGRLLEFISCLPLESYLGVDISEQAIQQARALNIPNASFDVGSAESFVPPRRFDVIVFNEIVFYLKDPNAVLLRYQQYLHDGGMMIVSMVDVPLSRMLWYRLGRVFETVETATVVNVHKHGWTIRVLRPRQTAKPPRASATSS